MIVLVLPTGAVVYDHGWQTVGDVMMSFHAFGVTRVYGQVQDEDGTPLTPMIQFPPIDGWHP